MRPLIKRITALGAATLLLACSAAGPRVPDPIVSQADAEDSYLAGRTHHMSLRFEQASTHYAAALRAAPGHVKARNGLAALYAEQGQLGRAIALWSELTASANGAGNAYLFSNLGYAHMLRGDFAQAQVALAQACLLDPLDDRAWQRLGDTLGKLGQSERAAAMYKQAKALRGHDLKSDYALARGAGVPASDTAVGVTRDDERWARTDVRQAADGTFVLRRIEADERALMAAVPRNFAGNVLLEITNGNGVKGMARSLARQAGLGTAQQVRLTNQKGFSVRHTRVEYKPAFKVEAEQLALRYGTSRVVRVGQAARADVRLVLGRDMLKAVPPVIATVNKVVPKAS